MKSRRSIFPGSARRHSPPGGRLRLPPGQILVGLAWFGALLANAADPAARTNVVEPIGAPTAILAVPLTTNTAVSQDQTLRLPTAAQATNVVTQTNPPSGTSEVRRTRATGSERAESAPPSPVARDYAAFKLITDRNIFSPSRSSRSARGGAPETRKTPKVDTLSLVGIMGYEKGAFAFFDGSSPEYKKVVKPTEAIAGHQVTGISANQVRLTAGGKEIELRPGMQLRREDEGQWLLVNQEAMVVRSSTAAKVDTGVAGGDDESEILKKLMQKRELEMNK